MPDKKENFNNDEKPGTSKQAADDTLVEVVVDKNPLKKGSKTPNKAHKDDDADPPPRSEKDAKRRNSLTDSPLTSSTVSAGDSADDTEISCNAKDSNTSSSYSSMADRSPGSDENLEERSKKSQNKCKAHVVDLMDHGGDAKTPLIHEDGKDVQKKKKKRKNSANNSISITTVDEQKEDRSNAGALDPELKKKLNNALMRRAYSLSNQLNSEQANMKEKIVLTHNQQLYNSDAYINGPRIQQYNTFPAAQEYQEEQYLSRVEMEFIRGCVDHQKKNLRQYSELYIRDLHATIFDGDFQNFSHRVRSIALTLAQKKLSGGDGGNATHSCDVQALIGKIIQKIVFHFRNETDGTNILTTIIGTLANRKSCADVDHDYCRIAQTILHYLTMEQVQDLVLMTTRSSGKTALHLAVIAGDICQMRVVLSTGVNPNLFDKSGRAAIHYAIERRSVQMVKLLMWYGADISLCQKNNFYSPRQLASSLLAPNNGNLVSYVESRLDALQHTFASWLKVMCTNFAQESQEISDVHFAKYYCLEDVGKCEAKRDCNLNFRDVAQFNRTGRKPFLFIIPVFFDESDENAGPAMPQFFRSTFVDGVEFNEVSFTANTRRMVGGSRRRPLTCAFDSPYFCAYELPVIIQEGCYNLSFHVKSATPFGSYAANAHAYPILALGCFFCQENILASVKSKLE